MILQTITKVVSPCSTTEDRYLLAMHLRILQQKVSVRHCILLSLLSFVPLPDCATGTLWSTGRQVPDKYELQAEKRRRHIA